MAPTAQPADSNKSPRRFMLDFLLGLSVIGFAAVGLYVIFEGLAYLGACVAPLVGTSVTSICQFSAGDCTGPSISAHFYLAVSILSLLMGGILVLALVLIGLLCVQALGTRARKAFETYRLQASLNSKP